MRGLIGQTATPVLVRPDARSGDRIRPLNDQSSNKAPAQSAGAMLLGKRGTDCRVPPCPRPPPPADGRAENAGLLHGPISLPGTDRMVSADTRDCQRSGEKSLTLLSVAHLALLPRHRMKQYRGSALQDDGSTLANEVTAANSGPDGPASPGCGMSSRRHKSRPPAASQGDVELVADAVSHRLWVGHLDAGEVPRFRPHNCPGTACGRQWSTQGSSRIRVWPAISSSECNRRLEADPFCRMASNAPERVVNDHQGGQARRSGVPEDPHAERLHQARVDWPRAAQSGWDRQPADGHWRMGVRRSSGACGAPG